MEEPVELICRSWRGTLIEKSATKMEIVTFSPATFSGPVPLSTSTVCATWTRRRNLLFEDRCIKRSGNLLLRDVTDAHRRSVRQVLGSDSVYFCERNTRVVVLLHKVAYNGGRGGWSFLTAGSEWEIWSWGTFRIDGDKSFGYYYGNTKSSAEKFSFPFFFLASFNQYTTQKSNICIIQLTIEIVVQTFLKNCLPFFLSEGKERNQSAAINASPTKSEKIQTSLKQSQFQERNRSTFFSAIKRSSR